MRKMLCWLFGHDLMQTDARRRSCLRCGQREIQRYFGVVLAWVEVGPAPTRPSRG